MKLKQSATFVIFFLFICTSIPLTNSWYLVNNFLDWISMRLELFKKLEIHNVCVSDACIETGKILLQGLNRNVDPCENFYEFACGNWPISNPIPPQKLDWSRSEYSESIIKERSLEILESKTEVNSLPPSKMMREFYNRCMDTESRERVGLEPINDVTKVMGGWPLIGAINELEEIKWQQVDKYYMQLTGSHSIFQITVSPEYLNRTDNQITIVPGKFPRSEFYPLVDRWKNWPEKDTPYTSVVKKAAKIFLNYQGINYTQKDFDSDIFDMLQFERELYKIQSKANNSFKDMSTIGELQRYYDSMVVVEQNNGYFYNSIAKINWLKITQELFAPWNFSIESDEELFIPSWNFFIQLPTLLNTTKNKVIVNYIHWKFVMQMMPFTNDQLKELVHTKPGIAFAQTHQTRREDCLNEVRLAHVLFREYALKYFPKRDKIDITNMAEMIREEAIELIMNSRWLDMKTRAEIMEKIRDIHIMIGYPDWYDDNGTQITKYYEKLIPGQSHFENTLRMMKFTNDKKLADFRQPMKKYEWFLQPLNLNGLYKYYYNSIIITMAFAQSPIYSADLPFSIKYGLLGSIIGHEIFHSLDPNGVIYDKDWKHINASTKTKNKYKKRIDCIIHQLDGSELMERDPTTNKTVAVKVRGNFTKNEDMADNEGIRVAFSTYRNNLEQREIPLRLIGLEEFNVDQLFFISYANKWCHSAKAKWWEDTYGKTKYDTHSPSRLRVNRPLSNFNLFAKAFDCSVGAKMNPQIKCSVFGGS